MLLHFELPIHVYLKVSVVDPAGKEKHPHSFVQELKTKEICGSNFGWPNFISRDTLFHKKNPLLKNDTLTLSVELIVRKDPEGLSNHQQIVSAPVNKELDTFKQLLRERNFTDITIKVKDESIRAHKILLAQKSPVWKEQMLSSENQNVLELEDVEFEIAKEILDFIYDDAIDEEFMDNHVMDLLAASDEVRSQI